MPRRSHEAMTDLYCMSFTSKGTSEILVAGSQDIMFVVDVNKGEIVKKVSSVAFFFAAWLSVPVTNSGRFPPNITTPS